VPGLRRSTDRFGSCPSPSRAKPAGCAFRRPAIGLQRPLIEPIRPPTKRTLLAVAKATTLLRVYDSSFLRICIEGRVGTRPSRDRAFGALRRPLYRDADRGRPASHRVGHDRPGGSVSRAHGRAHPSFQHSRAHPRMPAASGHLGPGCRDGRLDPVDRRAERLGRVGDSADAECERDDRRGARPQLSAVPEGGFGVLRIRGRTPIDRVALTVRWKPHAASDRTG